LQIYGNGKQAEKDSLACARDGNRTQNGLEDDLRNDGGTRSPKTYHCLDSRKLRKIMINQMERWMPLV